MNLSPELEKLRDEIHAYALEYGLDPVETIFEILDFDQINEVASYGGFPTRYPHWSFGMEYEHLKKSYSYGLHKIYEMVINNDPSYAYLLENNALVDQKIVMAHVYGHTDFFKNNHWFSATNRKMMDGMANHGTIMRNYAEKYGYEEVENFIDTGISIDDLIDFHSLFIKRHTPSRVVLPEEEDEEGYKNIKLRSKDYMDGFVNPPEFVEEQMKRLNDKKVDQSKFPERPEKDILLFLIDNAAGKLAKVIHPFCGRKLLLCTSATKIMNEGMSIGTDHHDGKVLERFRIDRLQTTTPAPWEAVRSINPYKLGIELFKDVEPVEQRKFGKEWDECDDLDDKKAGITFGNGTSENFEIRRVANDITSSQLSDKEFCGSTSSS